MASTHVSLISAGGTTNRRIASSIYGYCTTAAATAAKTVSLYTGNGTTADGTWAAADLFHGLTITVRFQYSNSVASPTLNVNGTGAKPIYRYGTTAPSTSAASSWRAQAVVDFTYDTLLNTNGCWVMHTTVDDNTTYSSMSQTEADTGTATTARSISAKVLNDTILTSTQYLDLARELADTYSASATYFVGEFCIYSSNVYACNTAITTAESWTSSHWTLIGAV